MKIDVNEDLEIDIENKYIKYKENVKFTTEEAIYILKRKDFCDEVENIAIENLIKENKELEMQLLEKDLYIDGLKENRRIAIEEIQEEYYISKDKIKEKIEEYEDILQSSIIKEDYKKEVEHIIRVLKELKGDN